MINFRNGIFFIWGKGMTKLNEGGKVITFYLLNIKSLLRPPKIATFKRRKILIKNRGIWGIVK